MTKHVKLSMPQTPLSEALGRKITRRDAEALIEALIDGLDLLAAPGEDLEPDLGAGDDRESDSAAGCSDDEPSLGWTPLMNQVRAMRFTAEVGLHEREFDGDTVADADAEPALGAPELGGSGDQRWWAHGGDVDEREDVSEDEGACIQSHPHDEEPLEPGLGWAETVDQSDLGRTSDAELGPTDCIERYRGRRESNMTGPAHVRDVLRQAEELRRRLGGQQSAPVIAGVRNVRPLTDAEMAAIFGRSR